MNTRGENNPFYGKSHSPETMRLMRRQHPNTVKVYVYNSDMTSVMKNNEPLCHDSRKLVANTDSMQRRSVSKAVKQGHITQSGLIYSPYPPLYNPNLGVWVLPKKGVIPGFLFKSAGGGLRNPVKAYHNSLPNHVHYFKSLLAMGTAIKDNTV